MLQPIFLQLLPNTPQQRMTGELTYKVVCHDYQSKNGTRALYLQCFLKGKKRMLPLHLRVPFDAWLADKQLVKGTGRDAKDLNLLIGQRKALANEILVRQRLVGRTITLDDFADKFLNPLPQFDFIAYMERAIEQRRGLLTPGSYKHHKSTLSKLRSFKSHIAFCDLNLKLFLEFKSWMKVKLKNGPNTINSTLKNIKTYLHYARDMDGVALPFDTKKLKLPNFAAQRSFLTIEEVETLERYYVNEFCPMDHKHTLQVFLFSCFTGARYSDLATLKRGNIFGDQLVFVPQKTSASGKMLTLKLTKRALRYVNAEGDLFTKVYSNQAGNRVLKAIAKQCGIAKNVSWHVARHTFATSFLTLGGSLDVLQNLLAHANIKETMRYTHIVDARKDEQMDLFDK